MDEAIRKSLCIKSVLTASALLLASCAQHQTMPVPQSQPLMTAQAFQVPGEYVHKQSGHVFPAGTNEFSRLRLIQYDAQELNVSAGYLGGSENCPIKATVYVYPAPARHLAGAKAGQSVAGAYEESTQALLTAHPLAESIDERPVDSRTSPGIRGDFANGRNIDVLQVRVDRFTWIIKHRYTFGQHCEQTARRNITKFEAQLSKSTQDGIKFRT